MKKLINKKSFLLFIAIVFISITSVEAQDYSIINDRIDNNRDGLKLIFQGLIGLAAIAGAFYTYLKMQNDDGGSGKKAIGGFVGALLFGSLAITIIEVFVG